jgi:hypothetical protein
LKNLFYREQEARQVLEYDYKELGYECDKHMELHIASDRDLVNSVATGNNESTSSTRGLSLGGSF